MQGVQAFKEAVANRRDIGETTVGLAAEAVANRRPLMKRQYGAKASTYKRLVEEAVWSKASTYR